MANITTRESAYDATPQELIDFLKEYWEVSRLVFDGIFTTDGIDLTRLRGLITDVTIEGKHVTFPFTGADFNRISVRKYGELKNSVKPGPCRFSCIFAPSNVRREKDEPFLLTVNLNTLRNINEDGSELGRSVKSRPSTTKPISVSDEETLKVMKRLRLSDCRFIGQFCPLQDGQNWIIADIRNHTSFTKVEDKERNIDNPKIKVSNAVLPPDVIKFAYYEFGWTLRKTDPIIFDFDPNKSISRIYPEDIVGRLHDTILKYDDSASRKITRMLDTLRKQLTQSGKEVFIYELLQNANDYPRKDENKQKLPVDVEFHITDQYLMFEHSGDYFNAKNIAAICDINDGEKSDNVDAIGYKGIGFKTVFVDNDYVLLHTGAYTFRFENNKEYPVNTPWQILPVWTNKEEVDGNIQNIFHRTDDREFRVKFALRPRDLGILTNRTHPNNYISLFKNVFETERVILFTPYIHKVSIYFGNKVTPDIVRSADSQYWCVSRAMADDVPERITERINDVLSDTNADKSDGYDKVPEKYKNFKKTSIKFACQRDGRKLKEVPNSHLYCYLPAKKADWGFKFLMNTDMVPNGERDDIEDIELNHEIAKIAGRQFFYWIKELIASGEYELDSIFNLIPDFNDCINRKAGYSTFIEEFRDEFEELIKSEPFVPCINNEGEEVDATIDDIINDETGVSAKGFMADTDFIELSNTGCDNLPIKELRTSGSFHTFLHRYSPPSNNFNFDSLKSVVSNDAFVEWLENEENDVNFIYHLLDEDKLTDFTDEEIFIEAGESLFCSGNIYVDFDSEMSRIDFMRDYIPYLSPSLRTKLSKHKNWADYEESYFKEFDAEDMLKEFILKDSDALATLAEEANSIAFFKFAAEKDIDMSVIEDISFFDEDGNMQSEYGKTYFYSEDVYSLSKAEWLPEDSLYILSHAYFDEPSVNDLLKEKLEESGIRKFDHGEFIHEKLIEDTDFASEVNELITDDFDKNLAFVLYAFAHKESLKEKDNQLKDFVLRCEDKDGEEVYLNKDDVRYFAHYTEPGNSSYNDNITFGWITNTMMYALHKDYIASVSAEQQKALESFLRQSFGVQTYTDKSFWSDVVSRNEDDIYELIESRDDALSFLSYIVRDRKILLDGSISFKDLQNIPLLRADGTVSNNRDYTLYAYDEVAEDMENRPWYTQEFYLLDKTYSEQLSVKELQLLQIESFDLQTALNALCEDRYFNPNTSDENTDFWRWVKSHAKDITDYTKLQAVSVYVDNSYSWEFNELYIPDAFFPIGEGIESLVKKFDEGATFVPVSLLEEETEKCKADWVRLLKKLNAKSDNKAILDHVLENLGEYEEDSVLALLTQHKKELFDSWNSYWDKLQKLKVRCRNNEYKTLDECIIVRTINLSEDAEPFRYIQIEDEVDPVILKGNSDIILKIAESLDGDNILSDREQWAKRKIDEYVGNIQDNEDERTKIHIQFIRDLAAFCESYNVNKDTLAAVKYLSKDGNYMDANELTLGSIYKPSCDFEAYGAELDYISANYISEDSKDADIIRRFFRKTVDIHSRFTKDDIPLMEQRQFAMYVWITCFRDNEGEFREWISEGEFDDYECIPTQDDVAKPCNLYSPILDEFTSVCKSLRAKVPAKAMISELKNRYSIFIQLPFMTELSTTDCLDYLLSENEKQGEEQRHREQIVNWLLANDDITEEQRVAYRSMPNALWRNGKGMPVHITELFAISPSATQERQVFGSSERVIRHLSFPIEDDKFERICSILGIIVLKSEDFETIPTPDDRKQTTEILKIIQPRLLVEAGAAHPRRYKEYYEKYLEVLRSYDFYVCDSIELVYGDLRGEVGHVYNDSANHRLYYVHSWDGKRTFGKFCQKLKAILGITSTTDEVFEEIMDDSVSIEQLIAKYCYSLQYDSDFHNYMEAMQQRVALLKEQEQESGAGEDEREQEDSSVYKRPKSDDEETVLSQDEVPSVAEVEIPIPEEEPVSEENNPIEEPVDEDTLEEEQSLEPEVISPQQPSQHRQEVATEKTLVAGPGEEVVGQHYRSGTWVEGYYRADGTYVSGHYRSDSIVSEHTRDIPETTHTSHTYEPVQPDSEQRESRVGGEAGINNRPAVDTAPKPKEPRNSNWKREPHNYSNEELDNMRSNGSPLELTTLPPTDEEVEILSKCGISPEKIADSNYVAQLRLYRNLQGEGQQPEESLEEFIQNAGDVTEHRLCGGKYIHTCSAARGVMYISPSIWNKVMDGQCSVCVYYGPHANQFFYIHTSEDLLKLVEKDDVVIKITGKEKVNVVGALYNGLLKNVKGTAYTLIRVAAHTEMDAVFARYVGAMAEKNDGNENEDEY